MHYLVAAGKGVFVLASGGVMAVAAGGVHGGITTGQLLSGGGGILLGLAILRGASVVGGVKQILADHDRRLRRLEGNEDARR